MSGKPHVDDERFRARCESKLELLDEAGVLGGRNAGGVGCRVTVESGKGLAFNRGLRTMDALVGHQDEKAFGGIFIGLNLVVYGVQTGAAGEE